MSVTERRIKAIYYREPLKLLADEWLAARGARHALRLDRAAQLRAELAELEGAIANDARLARRGDVLRLDSRQAAHCGAMVP